MDTHDARVTAPSGASEWLGPWLTWLDAALRREIVRTRARYELSADELHGLYVSHEQVDELVRHKEPDDTERELLERLDGEAQELILAAYEAPSPLRRIALEFELSYAGVLALVLCCAPEEDLSYQRIYAYLNDDVSRRLPTVDLCERLRSGASELSSDDAVFSEGLIRVHRQDSAPLWRSSGMVLSEPVRQFMFEPEGRTTLSTLNRAPARQAPRLLVIEAEIDDDATETARELALTGGWALAEPRRDASGATDQLLDAALTARLHHGALYVPARELGLDATGSAGTDRCRRLLELQVPLVLGIRPGWLARLPLGGVDHDVARAGRPSVAERSRIWWRELTAVGASPAAGDVAAIARLFVLGPSQIRAAAAAVGRSGGSDLASLSSAARESSGLGLGSVAERVSADYTWSDLVLPRTTRRRLAELADAIQHRHQVFGTWSFDRLAGGHVGVRALLSGPSGTGKTMSASVIAAQLGLDLYRVDLSAVVSKYIGETEKNLERVLAAAENSNAILLFDEADALFGRRSEVKDSHDRYANIEIAFLLQRIEAFDGVLLLATNLPGNLDDAFSRRMQFHIEFPLPDQAAREELWCKAIPQAAPAGTDIDPAFLAGMFAMTGGEVRSASLQAAFLAAHESSPIEMRHLVRALARQRRQMGKLPSATEFKGYLRMIRDDDG